MDYSKLNSILGNLDTPTNYTSASKIENKKDSVNNYILNRNMEFSENNNFELFNPQRFNSESNIDSDKKYNNKIQDYTFNNNFHKKNLISDNRTIMPIK